MEHSFSNLYFVVDDMFFISVSSDQLLLQVDGLMIATGYDFINILNFFCYRPTYSSQWERMPK